MSTRPHPFAFGLAERSDLPAITAIYNATVASRMVTADVEPVSVESRVPWFEAHTRERRPLWVARDADGGDRGEVLGWLGLQDFHVRCAYQGTAELSVYVHDQQRRRGLGRALLEHAIGTSSRVGIDTLVGLIFGHNVPSLSLFEALGFERWGLLPGVARLDGVRRDLVIVGRDVA